MSREEDDELEKEKLDEMNPDRFNRDQFLDAISQIESSGGKNLRHPTMDSGLHQGQHALGQYGLMPNTVKDTAKRMGAASPILPDTDIEQAMNPQVERQIASELAKRVLTKYPNEDMAAYSWNQGTSLSPKEIEARDYENSPYVQKFKKIRNMIGGK